MLCYTTCYWGDPETSLETNSNGGESRASVDSFFARMITIEHAQVTKFV